MHCCAFTNLPTLAGVFENIRLQRSFTSFTCGQEAQTHTKVRADGALQPGTLVLIFFLSFNLFHVPAFVAFWCFL